MVKRERVYVLFEKRKKKGIREREREREFSGRDNSLGDVAEEVHADTPANDVDTASLRCK
jgi:hypothetical protein